jgi:threonine dehydratase
VSAIDPPTFADVQDAAARLNGVAVRTPLLHVEALDEAVNGRVFVKAECLQRTGTFKFRGAYNRVSRLTEDERRRGVVAFSSGNHAQGVAAAAKMAGCAATIVMPADAPALKITRTRGYGAQVVLYDRFNENREAIAAKIASDTGAVVVPPFDDRYVIAGQGAVGLEIAEQLQETDAAADVLICPASGGGLMAGVALAFEARSPKTALYCAEPAGFEDYALSLKAGERVTITPTTASLCDALMSPSPGAITFPINQPRLAGAVAASDDEVLAAMAFAFEHLKLVVEPGGAAALAALLAGRVALNGRTAVIVASGGNVDPATFVRALTA